VESIPNVRLKALRHFAFVMKVGHTIQRKFLLDALTLMSVTRALDPMVNAEQMPFVPTAQEDFLVFANKDSQETPMSTAMMWMNALTVQFVDARQPARTCLALIHAPALMHHPSIQPRGHVEAKQVALIVPSAQEMLLVSMEFAPVQNPIWALTVKILVILPPAFQMPSASSKMVVQCADAYLDSSYFRFKGPVLISMSAKHRLVERVPFVRTPWEPSSASVQQAQLGTQPESVLSYPHRQPGHLVSQTLSVLPARRASQAVLSVSASQGMTVAPKLGSVKISTSVWLQHLVNLFAGSMLSARTYLEAMIASVHRDTPATPLAGARSAPEDPACANHLINWLERNASFQDAQLTRTALTMPNALRLLGVSAIAPALLATKLDLMGLVKMLMSAVRVFFDPVVLGLLVRTVQDLSLAPVHRV